MSNVFQKGFFFFLRQQNQVKVYLQPKEKTGKAWGKDLREISLQTRKIKLFQGLGGILFEGEKQRE